MAGGTKRRKFATKRKTRRTTRKRKTSRYAGIPRPRLTASGMPPNYPVNMKYACQFVVTVPAYGVPVAKQFRLNSLYSPEMSGGHQPYFYDQLKVLYDYYKVLSCTATINIFTPVALIASIRPDDNTTVPSNLTLEMERPSCPVVLFSSVGERLQYRKNYDIAKVLKMSRKEYIEDEQLKVPVGQSPGADYPAILNILMANPDIGDTNVAYCYLTVVLQYQAVMLDITVQSQS